MGKRKGLGYIPVTDGRIYYVGDGYFTVLKEGDGRMHNIVVTHEDAKSLRIAECGQVRVEDGTAQHMGDGIWLVTQLDELDGELQDVMLTRGDCEAILAAYGCPTCDSGLSTVQAGRDNVFDVVHRGGVGLVCQPTVLGRPHADLASPRDHYREPSWGSQEA